MPSTMIDQEFQIPVTVSSVGRSSTAQSRLFIHLLAFRLFACLIFLNMQPYPSVRIFGFDRQIRKAAHNTVRGLGSYRFRAASAPCKLFEGLISSKSSIMSLFPSLVFSLSSMRNLPMVFPSPPAFLGLLLSSAGHNGSSLRTNDQKNYIARQVAAADFTLIF